MAPPLAGSRTTVYLSVTMWQVLSGAMKARAPFSAVAPPLAGGRGMVVQPIAGTVTLMTRSLTVTFSVRATAVVLKTVTEVGWSVAGATRSIAPSAIAAQRVSVSAVHSST